MEIKRYGDMGTRGCGDEIQHHWYHIFYHRNRLAKGKNRLERLFILITPLILIACRQNYDPKLPAYLKAEKELRSRVTLAQGLEDSISLLAKKFKVNPEKQIAGLKNNPRAWLLLVDELIDKKIRDKDKNAGKREKK